MGTPTRRQQEAIGWNDGSLLVNAGPGAGKTRVLTARIARILRDNIDNQFHVLALTYTNKAADEMRGRVNDLEGNIVSRTFIGTFHSFCAKILRQHGKAIGIKPDFEIYSDLAVRHELLKNSLEKHQLRYNLPEEYEKKWLHKIDDIRRDGKVPEEVEYDDDEEKRIISKLYKEYEQSLHDSNALDFHGLVLNACRLMKTTPAVASHYRRQYRYWLIDEFQDTTGIQYQFIKILAGSDFRNIFVVGDLDQIIFQFAGANLYQIKKFERDFKPNRVNLNENFRSHESIVHAADLLIANNPDRPYLIERQLIKASSDSGGIDIRSFFDEISEAREIVQEIIEHIEKGEKSVAVLARTRKVLESILYQFRQFGTKAIIAGRRDDFVSPHFRWLLNCLELVNSPKNQLTLEQLTKNGNRIARTDLSYETLVEKYKIDNVGILEQWAKEMGRGNSDIAIELASLVNELVHSPSKWQQFAEHSIQKLLKFAETSVGYVNDISEDKRAWKYILQNVLKSCEGKLKLFDFIHEMHIRSKEPPADSGEIKLYTIHSAKGLEFDHVWLAGMTDSILPSYRSVKLGANPRLLEEERRICYVGVTRARKNLVLTYPKISNGRPMEPSRFLREMGLV